METEFMDNLRLHSDAIAPHTQFRLLEGDEHKNRTRYVALSLVH